VEDFMKLLGTVGLVLCGFTLAGCHKSVEISPAAMPAPERWNATLATPAGLAGAVQVKGTAWMEPDVKDTAQTKVHVEISNAAPGGAHPWHVHRGQCGQDGGIFGPPDAYRILKVGGNGEAKAEATLPLPEPKDGQYFVNVHASTANMGTIVACGNLAPPSH
jgi:hypothetical protein